MITYKQCFVTDGKTFETVEKAQEYEFLKLLSESTVPSPTLMEISELLVSNRDLVLKILQCDIADVKPHPSSVKILPTKTSAVPSIKTIEDFDKMVLKFKYRDATIATARAFVIRYLNHETLMKCDIMAKDKGEDGAVSGLFREFVKLCGDRIHKRYAGKSTDGKTYESRSYYRLPSNPMLTQQSLGLTKETV